MTTISACDDPRAPGEGRDQSALERIRAILGPSGIVSCDEEIDRLSRTIIPRSKRPVGFVYPESIDHLRSIMRIANEQRVPVWPCSKGKNWGYGSATAVRDGSLVIILERMNKIVEVNEELAYAIVEPGVTYRQLHEHLQERGSKLWLDCTDGPADASVMGNALERGVGETPYGDHFGNICGMEVMLPDGEIFQTGGGPFGRYKSWNTYKWGVGPYLEGLFSQSNYGIVTRVGMWLMPQPPCFLSCLFELKREEDLPALADALRRLQLNGAIQSKVHLINDAISLAIVADDTRTLRSDGACLSDEEMAALRRKHQVAPWTFAAGLYGTSGQVRANVRLIRKELRRYGRLRFIGDRQIKVIRRLLDVAERSKRRPATAWCADALAKWVFRKPLPLVELLPNVHAIEKGYPSDYFVKHAYFKCRRPKPDDDDIDPARDNCGLIWLGPMVPLDGPHTEEILTLCRPLYAEHGFEFTVAMMIGNARTNIALMSIFYDRDDPDETRRAEALYYEIGKVTQAAGYQQYRTSVAYMDRILAPAPEFLDVSRRIKAALDPNDILAPGKYGIDAA